MLGKEPSRERRSGARRQYRFAVRPLMPVRAVARWCSPNMADNLILRAAFSAEIAVEQGRGGFGNPAGASFYRLIGDRPYDSVERGLAYAARSKRQPEIQWAREPLCRTRRKTMYENISGKVVVITGASSGL